MSIQVFGMAVSRGVAIGRAVLVASSRVDVAHYFVAPDRIEAEIERLRAARNEVVAELTALKPTCRRKPRPSCRRCSTST
jgi:phosphoenolpyruvate-protein phosphotransferase (PTS system enzyme I)